MVVACVWLKEGRGSEEKEGERKRERERERTKEKSEEKKVERGSFFLPLFQPLLFDLPPF